MDLYEGVETMSLDGKSYVPLLPNLAEGQDRTVHYFQLFPNLLISPHRDYVMTHRLIPLTPDRTAVECEWLFSKEAVAQEDFAPSYAGDFWDVTNRQDWHACESVQRGLSSRGYRRGPLSPREDAVYQLSSRWWPTDTWRVGLRVLRAGSWKRRGKRDGFETRPYRVRPTTNAPGENRGRSVG